MDYIKPIMITIQMLCGIPLLWGGIVVVLSIFTKNKKLKKSDKKHKFGVVICAHNEERTIGLLLNSIGMADYPGDRYHIFVLAHNCEDNTADIVRRFDSTTLIEVNDKEIRSKGALLVKKLPELLDEYCDDIDAITFFDADNVVDKGYFEAMNDHIAAGEKIIMGDRQAGGSLHSAAEKFMCVYWIVYDAIISVSRYKVGLSPMITGTGFTIEKNFLKETPWDTKSITEDVEYSVIALQNGQKVTVCTNASFYDEQPDNFRALTTQLHRWCTGNYEILSIYMGKLLGTMFTDVKKFDMTLNLFLGPLSVIGLFMFVAVFILALVSFDTTVLMVMGVSMVISYIAVVLITAFLILRIKRQEDKKKLLPVALATPVFLIYYTLCSFAAWVHPQRKWVPIRHKGISAD